MIIPVHLHILRKGIRLDRDQGIALHFRYAHACHQGGIQNGTTRPLRPRGSFRTASATLPPNPKCCSVSRPLNRIVPRNSFSTSATLPPGLKYFHVPCAPRRAVPPRFRAFLDFVPFRVHGSTNFRDDYICVQSHTKYQLNTFCKDSSHLIPFSVHYTRDVAR